MANDLIDITPEEQDDDFNYSNPRSLINLVPTFLRDQLRGLSHSYLSLSERELEERLFQGELPDGTSASIKLQFWDEYDTVQRHNEPCMQITRILAGIGTVAWFKRFIADELRLAWLIRLPSGYDIGLRDIHALSLRRMREAMQLNACKDPDKPNVKLMEVQFKIAQHVDMRLKGAVIQRVEQRNLNMNVNADANKPLEAAVVPQTMAEIEMKLAEARQKSMRLEAPAVIAVDLLSSITAKEPVTIEANAKSESRHDSDD